MQTAYFHDFLMFLIRRDLMLAEGFFPLRFRHDKLAALVVEEKIFFVVDSSNNLALRLANRLRQAFLDAFLLGQKFRVAAEQDVRAAASHIGGDGDGALASGLGHDFGFALVKLGVENYVANAFA